MQIDSGNPRGAFIENHVSKSTRKNEIDLAEKKLLHVMENVFMAPKLSTADLIDGSIPLG